MKHWKRWMVLATGAAALGACSACSMLAGPPEIPVGHGEQMQAIVFTEYGTPDVLRLETVDVLQPKDEQVLVRVRAAAANPLDWHRVRGTPYLVRMNNGFRAPQNPRLGADMAGEVVAVGRKVTKFKPGDRVFGVAGGAFAEYVRPGEQRIALMPPELEFDQAAAIPVAAVTALQGLRDHGQLQPGQKVLINGASGGVGTFAIQLARVMGAEVTAVCSKRNEDLVRSLGAQHVIDYTAEDFTLRPERYDVVIDNVGMRPLSEMQRVLTDTGIVVTVGGGGPDEWKWFGPMLARPAMSLLKKPFSSKRHTFFIAEVTPADLEYVAGLMAAGKVTAAIDRRYPLDQVPEAIRYLETGRARGKVIIEISPLAWSPAGIQLAQADAAPASDWPAEINLEWE
jgi:NADPH:quinone reductase-like Zn-dependent oxidoreductase